MANSREDSLYAPNFNENPTYICDDFRPRGVLELNETENVLS